jgi:hypothetical protein
MLSQAHLYNDLLEIGAAERELHDRAWKEDLSAIAETIVEHGFEEFFGIRLLHKHNNLANDEIMLEFEEAAEEAARCLTTTAMCKDEIRGHYYPNSWKWHDARMVPIEYSKDETVSLPELSNTGVGKFFEDFGAIVQRRGLSELLGPFVVPRAFYANKSEPSDVLVETTDELRRANIVRYSSLLAFNREDLVEAAWTVKTQKDLETMTICFVGCFAEKYCTKDPNTKEHVNRSRHPKLHKSQ